MTRPAHPVSLLLLLASLYVSSVARGQAVPNVQSASSYQGFHLPTVGGTMSYSVTLSGNASRGYYGTGGTSGFTSISGNLALLSSSKRDPFSMIYSGGYFANLTGDAPSSVFQNLALSQVLTRGRWIYTVSDSISYLPQTATTGISGVPGVGDTGTAPVDVGTGTSQGVLTYNQSRVSNTLIGSVQRRLTASTSLSGTGTYSLSRFLGSSSQGSGSAAFNSDQYSGGLNLSHRLDARNTLGGGYSYFHASYPGALLSADPAAVPLASAISSNSFTIDYTRLVTRRLSISLAAGPQLTSIPSTAVTATGYTTGTGTSLNATINAGLTYTARAGGATVNYSRGTNAGSGVITGASTDSVQASASRRLTRVWNGSTSAGYSRSSSLLAVSSNPFVSNTLSATGQINRAVGRHLSAYGSYTAQRQSNQGLAATGVVFSGLSQTIAAGITYSPGVIGRSRR